MSVHDYVIANASGATVRGDLNLALLAIVSNNSNATAPSPTFAYMWWYDTTADALKQRNAANTAWHTIVTVDQTNGLLRWDFDRGADIASATTTDIGAATGNSVTITGTTTITGLGTIKAGVTRLVRLNASLLLTHNATSLILPGGANIQTASGDMMLAESLGSGNWRVPFYQRADGKSVIHPLALETEQATTSGTAFDFTGIPADAKRITIMFDGVSLSGTDTLFVQIGDSGGIEATGYIGTSTETESGAGAIGTSDETTAFVIRTGLAASAHTGIMVLTLMDSASNKWISSHAGRNAVTRTVYGGGSKSLTAVLDRVRVTRNGTDTFDAGAVNILIE